MGGLLQFGDKSCTIDNLLHQFISRASSTLKTARFSFFFLTISKAKMTIFFSSFPKIWLGNKIAFLAFMPHEPYLSWKNKLKKKVKILENYYFSRIYIDLSKWLQKILSLRLDLIVRISNTRFQQISKPFRCRGYFYNFDFYKNINKYIGTYLSTSASGKGLRASKD